MKVVLYTLLCLLLAITVTAQRPATAAETAEDHRVKQIIHDALPDENDVWIRESGETDTDGILGFHDYNADFRSQHLFEHVYKASYRLKNMDDLRTQFNSAASTSAKQITYLENQSRCELFFYVNTNYACNPAYTPFKKISNAWCDKAYRDEAGMEYALFFFGDKWTFTPSSNESNGEGQVYCLKSNPHDTYGTIVQSVKAVVHAGGKAANYFISHINWSAIKGLLKTGQISEITNGTVTERAVPPVPGSNTMSFTAAFDDGKTRLYEIKTTKGELDGNYSRFRNHNPNPAITERARTDVYMNTGANSFHISVPIIRTTGDVLVTFQSDHDYEAMWSAVFGDEFIIPANITVRITKWAPPGDFMEGTFSGEASYRKGVNNFDSELPRIKIMNGKFRVRRMKDQY